MIIKLRVRSNKLNPENTNIPIMNDEFLLFDNCYKVKFGRRTEVDKSVFIKYIMNNLLTNRKDMSKAEADQYLLTQNDMEGRPFDNYHFMLKDAYICGPDEKYHYNVAEWVDRTNGKTHRLVYDTLLFIQDDHGSTIEKVYG